MMNRRGWLGAVAGAILAPFLPRGKALPLPDLPPGPILPVPYGWSHATTIATAEWEACDWTVFYIDPATGCATHVEHVEGRIASV